MWGVVAATYCYCVVVWLNFLKIFATVSLSTGFFANKWQPSCMERELAYREKLVWELFVDVLEVMLKGMADAFGFSVLSSSNVLLSVLGWVQRIQMQLLSWVVFRTCGTPMPFTKWRANGWTDNSCGHNKVLVECNRTVLHFDFRKSAVHIFHTAKLAP